MLFSHMKYGDFPVQNGRYQLGKFLRYLILISV